MDRDLLREFVKETLVEAALDPGAALKQGLGLVAYDMGAKKALVLFHVKKAAEAAYKLKQEKGDKATSDDYMNVLESNIVGFVLGKSPEKGPSWGAMMISSSAAAKGFGPMMYDIAMSKWGRIMPDRKFVSPSAEKVWTYYANGRKDVERLQFDDIEDPKTPDPQDDAVIHHKNGLKGPLNGAYEGAQIDTKALEAAAHKFFLWAQAAKLDVNMMKTALRHAGAGFFRVQYTRTD